MSSTAHVHVPTGSHLQGSQARILDGIRAPEVNLAVWQRPLEADLLAAARGFAAGNGNLTLSACPRSIAGELYAALAPYEIPMLLRDRWIADMAGLAREFARLDASERLQLRLETVRDDGCRRFHTDLVTLRLLCTYWGPATQWLDNAQVDRQALQNGQPNAAIALAAPSQLGLGWVALLKGDAYPGNADQGIVHRSPPIAREGVERVLLCIDSGTGRGC